MPRFTKEELKNSKRIYKSATPKYTADWYVKWIASIFILSAVVARSAGIEYHMIDVWFSFIGTGGWLLVGILWKDRALIMLNAVIFTVLGQAIIRSLTGG